SHTSASCRQYAESFRGTAGYFWAIQLKRESATHIGNLAAYVDARNKVAELSILIGERTHGGKGFGTEAWSAALRFLVGTAHCGADRLDRHRDDHQTDV